MEEIIENNRRYSTSEEENMRESPSGSTCLNTLKIGKSDELDNLEIPKKIYEDLMNRNIKNLRKTFEMIDHNSGRYSDKEKTRYLLEERVKAIKSFILSLYRYNDDLGEMNTYDDEETQEIILAKKHCIEKYGFRLERRFTALENGLKSLNYNPQGCTGLNTPFKWKVEQSNEAPVNRNVSKNYKEDHDKNNEEQSKVQRKLYSKFNEEDDLLIDREMIKKKEKINQGRVSIFKNPEQLVGRVSEHRINQDITRCTISYGIFSINFNAGNQKLASDKIRLWVKELKESKLVKELQIKNENSFLSFLRLIDNIRREINENGYGLNIAVKLLKGCLEQGLFISAMNSLDDEEMDAKEILKKLIVPILKHFDMDKNKFLNLIGINSMGPNENVNNWRNRCHAYMRCLTDCTKEDIKEVFITGINMDFKTQHHHQYKMLKQNDDNFIFFSDNNLSKVKKLEEEIRMLKRQNQKWCNRCKSNSHNTDKCYFLKDKRDNGNHQGEKRYHINDKGNYREKNREVNKVHHNDHFENRRNEEKKVFYDRKDDRHDNKNQQNYSRKFACYNCGENHPVRDCDKPKNKENIRRNIEKMNRNKRVVSYINDEDSGETTGEEHRISDNEIDSLNKNIKNNSNYSVFSIENSNSIPRIEKKMKGPPNGKVFVELINTNGQPLVSLLDSGSNIHLIKESDAKKLDMKIVAKINNKYSGVVNGNESIKIIGTAVESFIIGNKICKMKFHIASNIPINIISWQNLSRYGELIWFQNEISRIIVIAGTKFVSCDDGMHRAMKFSRIGLSNILKNEINDKKEEDLDQRNNLWINPKKDMLRKRIDELIKERDMMKKQLDDKINEIASKNNQKRMNVDKKVKIGSINEDSKIDSKINVIKNDKIGISENHDQNNLTNDLLAKHVSLIGNEEEHFTIKGEELKKNINRNLLKMCFQDMNEEEIYNLTHGIGEEKENLDLNNFAGVANVGKVPNENEKQDKPLSEFKQKMMEEYIKLPEEFKIARKAAKVGNYKFREDWRREMEKDLFDVEELEKINKEMKEKEIMTKDLWKTDREKFLELVTRNIDAEKVIVDEFKELISMAMTTDAPTYTQTYDINEGIGVDLLIDVDKIENDPIRRFSKNIEELMDPVIKDWERVGFTEVIEEKDALFIGNLLHILRDGKIRVCYDCSTLNEHIQNKIGKFHSTEEIFSRLNPDHSVAFVIDLMSAFNNVLLSEEASKYCCFYWKGKIYRFKILFFGIKNGPFLYNEFIRKKLKLDELLIYIDDIFGGAKNWSELLVLFKSWLFNLSTTKSQFHLENYNLDIE
eukprot:TRINITY_DN2670_c0_g1_i1.p1 TRINITY_DN2670_c0_g1~~TRINITY_DN2670_c0_g1_i1.p1  ORF type:complete len:1304 (+),score=371.20 TRINITY_DN2670_c0_g1_i1:3912-7823(+)